MRNIRTTTAKNTNTKSPEIDVKSEAVDVDPPLQFTADQRVMTGGGGYHGVIISKRQQRDNHY